MPEINVKSYNETVETLENMLQGVKAYKDMPGFPSVVSEESLTEMISKFKSTRDNYEKSSSDASQHYLEYNAQLKSVKDELMRYKSMLYGFFGKKNPIVSNFGIRPFKSKAKKQKAQPASKAA
ncbi:MAG: hypothetical protein OEV78_05275 [Spirochaetia bacterium]|nr:hypothetical protein [Spirochaetia bacterium]